MKCEEIRKLLTSYMLGDLAPATIDEIKAHLEKCDGCRAAAREIEPTLDLLRDALAAPSIAPAHLAPEHYKRIISALPEFGREVRRQGAGRVWRIDKWIIQRHHVLAAAAAAVVVIGFLWVMASSFISFGLRARPLVDVMIMEPEAAEELDEIEELELEPPEEIEITDVEFTPDVTIDTLTPTPDTDFSPQPAKFDSVAMVKSPVIMHGIYGARSPGARGRALGRYGGSPIPEQESAKRRIRETARQRKQEGVVESITFGDEVAERETEEASEHQLLRFAKAKKVARKPAEDKKDQMISMSELARPGVGGKIAAARPVKPEARRALSELGAMVKGLSGEEKKEKEEKARLRDLIALKRKSGRREPEILMSSARKRPAEESTRVRLLNKLEKIKIPEIDFREANIHDVIDFLQEATVEFDSSDKPPEKKGANIILNLGSGHKTSVKDGAEEDIFAASAEDQEVGGEVPRITFSAKNISAKEALKIVTEVANLKYRIEDDHIMIVPHDAPEGEIVHRMYEVLPSVRERMTAMATIDESPKGEDWKEFFAEMGVKWPEGSAIKYIPSIGKIVVANTADNLTVFEDILPMLNVPEEEPPDEEKAEEEDLTGPRFRAVGVNPFYSVSARPFSTFAIDVDTAAYTLARNYMLRGLLPPAEAVRTEEFVNFFDYAYKAPVHETFKVYAECAPSKFGRGLHLLKLGVKGRRLGREEQRRAVLTFLVDTSGSMNMPDRLGLVKKSLRMLVAKLAPHDMIAIVQYASHARLVLEHTPVAQKKRILKAIDSLQCGGSTNLEEGMGRAYGTAGRNFIGGGENRVLLLSDGVANLGTMAAEDILNKIGKYREQGVYCSVFGFGIGTYDDTMLETLANKGDGTYSFIDSEEEARRVFVDDLAATLNTIGADVKIQVEFNPNRVKRYRQLGYENRQLTKEQFRDDTVDAGEVGSGQAVTALYELELTGKKREPIGVVRVRYRRTDTGKVEEIERPITASDIVRRFDDAPERFRLAACVAEFAEILRDCPHAAGSEYNDVAKVLRPVALEMSLDKRVQELVRMVAGAGSMARGY